MDKENTMQGTKKGEERCRKECKGNRKQDKREKNLNGNQCQQRYLYFNLQSTRMLAFKKMCSP